MATIPQRTISQFKSKLIGGGTRPNLFEVQVNFPDGVNLGIQGDGGGEFDGDRFRFLCKAAQLPASNVGVLEVPFRGRVMKVSGDRTIDTWTVTVINDQDFDPSSYMGQATVYQLGRNVASQQGSNSPATDSNILAQYKFVDIFPTTISAIDLSYDTTDTIEEFTVDFQVQYWYPEAAGAGA